MKLTKKSQLKKKTQILILILLVSVTLVIAGLVIYSNYHTEKCNDLMNEPGLVMPDYEKLENEGCIYLL